MAILVTVMVLLIISVLGATVITLGQLDQAVSANYRSRATSFYLADSALEMLMVDLAGDIEDDPADNWLTSWIDTSTNPPDAYDPFPDVSGDEVNGHVLSPASPSPDSFAGTPYDLGGQVPLGAGNYERILWLPPTVTPEGANGTSFNVALQVRAIGNDTDSMMSGSSTVEAEVRLDLRNVTPWNHALVIGDGQGGSYLAGDLLAAGSIHLIGDGTGPTADFGNGSTQQNNYRGISGASALDTLSTKLPALGTVDHNGETVTSLDAVLRLAEGTVDLGAAGALGAADQTGNTIKETLDALYTDGTLVDPSGNSFADESDGYDAGTAGFFDLTSPYTDPATGTPYASYSAYLAAVAYSPIVGDLQIDCGTGSFSHTDPLGAGSIAWDQATETLTIDGTVMILGNIILAPDVTCGGGGPPGGGPPGGGGKGKGKGKGGGPPGGGPPGGGGGSTTLTAVNYEGTGVLYALNDIEIHGDLLPVGQYLEDGADADAAVDGNLGLIAGNILRLATDPADPAIVVMAALFAQSSAVVGNDVNVAGSLVSHYLTVGANNLLRLWHVPALGLIYPDDMPTGTRYATGSPSTSSWYQRR